MLILRFLALLLCAEWLLLFRGWSSLKYLIVFMAAAVLRARILNFIPHWDTHAFLYLATFPALLYHLPMLGRTARYREAYGTPDTGIPWLVIVARTEKAAYVLEIVIITAFIAYMDAYGAMIFPSEFGTLNPAWQDWLSEPGHAERFAFAYATTGMFGLVFWIQLHCGLPLGKPKTDAGAVAYQDVRDIRRRTPPKLANVKELSEELQQFYE
jgi:hypothetical protein